MVLTANGKSATGKCFDVPYYKHVSSLYTEFTLSWSCLKPRHSSLLSGHVAIVTPCEAYKSSLSCLSQRCVVDMLQYSPELKMLDDQVALQHFAAKGQFEGRHFKFKPC